jgi:two-component system response regulator DesR
VRNYLSAAMAKLGVASRHAAAHRAWEEGWV